MTKRTGIRGSWGAYIQHGNLEELEILGSELNSHIQCPVHFPAYGKNLFECKCGIVFPYYMVKSKRWEEIIKKHNRGEN